MLKYLVVLGLVILPSVVFAAPDGTIEFYTADNGRNILFTVTPSEPTVCNFNFFAHMRASKLEQFPAAGIRIATFGKPTTSVAVEAFDVPRIREVEGKPKRFSVYLKLYFTCEGDADVGSTPTYRLRLSRSKHGAVTTVRQWIFGVKYHMRYAAQ